MEPDQDEPAVVDGTRFEVNGREVLLILTPWRINRTDGDRIINQIIKMEELMPVIFISRRKDGSLYIAHPEKWKNEISEERLAQITLTKIPIIPA
jgi:hypothetical protein